MSNSFDEISELACDEKVTKHLNYRDRFRYANLIIEAASNNNINDNSHYINHLSKNVDSIKERIDCIMNYSKMSIYKKVIMSALTFSMICFGFIPVFAAPIPQMVNLTGDFSSDEMPYGPLSEYTFDYNNGVVMSQYNIIYDEQFVSETGRVSNVSQKTPRVNCNHTYVSGTYSKHTKKSKGGCTVKLRESKQCTKCGTHNIGDIISTTQYKTCPH